LRQAIRAGAGFIVCVTVAIAAAMSATGGLPASGTRRRVGVASTVKKVMPAVVRVYGRRSAGFRGVGAGVILTADGVIVTHTSNVTGVDEPMVLLDDGRRFKAAVIGTDSESELAVLRIQAKGLPTLRIADSAKVRPGQWVLAIGNPFGMAREAEDDLSANLGVITAYSQVRASGFKYRGYVFLTDAQINPGSYGGALVDLNGLLVALNGRIVKSKDTNTEMGVAIPVNDVLPAVVRILKQERQATTRPGRPSTRPATTQPAVQPRPEGERAADDPSLKERSPLSLER